MSPEKRPRGRLRQSEVFFPLADRAIVAHHVVLPGLFVLVLSRIIQILDRAIVIFDEVLTMSTFASPFWFLKNIALAIKN